ncbi:efflux RND transporter periplasmic adaptor subunit [Paludibacterium paludis]|uniref:MexX family efflux pump subunit n=1 Tax=Paludibacterium paludis TaxID=1225769 RepID=A0A918P5X8_9NEIS|nr:efflux RND transporter periplasmic adaptor subunit [Paludibacterium paludis]GGY23102.1 MexX family efflux pump subunit [Paludibacterium paludis]
MQNKQRFSPRVTVLAFATALALTGCGNKNGQQGPQTGPLEVGVLTLQTDSVPLIRELPARTSALRVADVRPQVGGVVVKRLFQEGGVVKAGQPLYQIDPETYRAAYEQAQANHAKAQANLTTARLKAKRYAELVEIKAVSSQEFDDARAALQQAEADAAATAAAAKTARINLNYSTVTSPITGRIGKSSVTEGALVTANQPTALATVQEIDRMYVDLTQSSSELLKLRHDFEAGRVKNGAGQAKVKLILEDGSEYREMGSLAFSDITVDPTTGSVLLRAVFPNPRHELLPGMFVRARLEQGIASNAIQVPQQAVTRTPKGDAMVLVPDSQGKVTPRIIKVAGTVGQNWLVTDGLKAGDQVIMDNLMKIRPGMPVKTVPYKPAAPAAQK